MASKVAEAFIAVRVLATNLKAQMGRVKGVFVRGLAAMKASAQSTMSGGLFSIPALLGGAAAIKGIKTFANFEQTMARVDAVVGEGTESFNKLNATAKELGRTTEFSASQAAEAMANFAVAGFKTDEIIAAMPDTLNLASAGQLQVGESAGIVANIMRGMGKDASQLGDVVNVLTRAFTSANTDLPQLGLAFRQVGPLARTMGKDFEEVTATIQVMSDAGIQGASAGTALRNVYARLASAPAEVRKALDTLGISIQDSNGKMLKMDVIVDKLNASMEGMSPIQKQNILTQLAGLKAMAAFSAVVETGGQKLRDNEANLRSGVDAQKVAARQLDTLKGQWKLFESALEGVTIELGSILAPILRDVVKTITDFTSSLSEMSPETKKLIGDIAKVVLGFVSFKLAMFALKKAFGLVSMAMGTLLSPLGLILATGLIVARLLSGSWSKTWTNIKKFADEAWLTIKAIFNNMGAAARIVWNLIKLGAMKLWQGLIDIFFGIGAVAAGAFNSIWEAMKAVVENIKQAWKGLKASFLALFSAIGAALEAALDMENPKEAFKKKFAEVMNDFRNKGGGFKDVGKAMGKGWREGFDGVWNSRPNFSGEMQAIKRDLDKDINTIAQAKQKMRDEQNKKKPEDKKKQVQKGAGAAPGVPVPDGGRRGEAVKVKFETSGFTSMWQKVQESITGASLQDLGKKQVDELAKVNKNLGQANQNLRLLVEKKDQGAVAS